ncbi:uncharacterized protein [Coffea arabica]|uniref:Reverse transcriptase zinc-binding domain-containing protein n=1 Tax=Coffea arabica TaxID=13443 RepID=A0ABM4URB8_COFAR
MASLSFVGDLVIVIGSLSFPSWAIQRRSALQSQKTHWDFVNNIELRDPLWPLKQQVQFDPSKKDSMVWSPSANGLFSVSTAWETVRKRKNISLVSGLIWNAIVPIKLSFFVWRLLHNLLPLEENLQQKRFKSVEGR